MDWRGVRYSRSAITFPFFIYCETDALNWPLVEGSVNGIDHIVRAPRLMGDLTRRTAPRFDLAPLMGEKAQTVRFMADFPTLLAADGSAGIQLVYEEADLATIGYHLINAVEVDIVTGPALAARFAVQAERAAAEGYDDPLSVIISCSVLSAQCSVLSAQCSVLSAQCSVHEAERLAQSAMSSLRRSTRQYWVNSPDEELKEWGVLTFALDAKLRLRSDPADMVHVITWSEHTRLVSQSLWSDAWREFDANPAVLPLDLVLKAQQEAIHENLPAAALQAGLAMDLCRQRLWDGLEAKGRCSPGQTDECRTNPKRPWRYFGSKLKEHVTPGAQIRSLEDERPEVFAAVEKLYHYRNDAAHAKPLKGDPAAGDLKAAIDHLFALIDFCNDVMEEA